jgi:hypothetical protein
LIEELQKIIEIENEESERQELVAQRRNNAGSGENLSTGSETE